MKNFKYILAGFLLFVTFSCEAVFTSHPIGKKIVKLNGEDWEGTWLHKEGSLVTKVFDSEKGILTISWIEPKGQEFKHVTEEVYIRESGELMFWSMKDKFQSIGGKSGSQKDRYIWGKIQKDGRQIIVWRPDIDYFKQLVNNGELPGKIDDGSVFLDDLKPEQLKIFKSETEGLLYNREEPVALLQIFK